MAGNPEVIVVGLGAMGSAAAFHLARRGRRVLGLDRFTPPHAFGSSHGQTRIIREAYFEHPLYVPLIQRAYELWTALEREAGENLFRPTGGLMIGRPDSIVVSGALRSAREHGLRHELLDAAAVRRRYPALAPADDMAAVWEPRAGILFPERCVAAHLNLAQRAGAELRFGEAALRWRRDGESVRVETDRAAYTTESLVLTAGSWLPSLVPELHPPLTVERQIQFWFETVRPDLFGPDQCPIHIWEHEPGRHFYGFPDLGEGVKVALHHEGRLIDPDQVDRTVAQKEIDSMRTVLARHLPGANGRLRATAVCMYTNTPDHHFLIDHHPEHARILIASPCSGHGFKFSCVIGEIIADLISGGVCRFDLSLFGRRG